MNPLPSPQQLRYLVALDDQQHFGRAASSCAVSQSTLSAGLLALESQLRARLLDRESGKRLLFTPLGREVVARARLALTALQGVSEAVAAQNSLSGPLRIGVIPTIGPYLLPRLMPALREAFPGLRIFLREDTTPRLVERLRDRQLDLALLALPCRCAGADTLALARDPLVVAMPAGHVLARLEKVPAAALRGERLLLLEDGHCLRDQILDACGLHARDNPEGYAATSLHTLVQMVAGGLGLTLLPRLAVSQGLLGDTGAVTRPLAGDSAWRTLALGWRAHDERAGQWQGLGPVLTQTLAMAA